MPAPVRVAFVSPHAVAGGAERYLELLLEGLGPGWVAGVVCLQDGWLAGRLRDRGVPVAVVPTGRRAGILAGAVRLRRVLTGPGRPDVVHANGVKAALVAGLALAGTPIPVVWVKHDFAWDGPLARVTARLCRDVVGVSAAVVEVLGGPGPRVHVVPNGVPARPADAAAGRRRLDALVPGDGPVVLAAGRLTRVKGLEDVLAAAVRLPAVRVVLAGGPDPFDPAYEAELRARITALDLAPRVVLAGHQPEPLELIAGADAVAVTSGARGAPLRGEGFGLVALEAMSAGTPVVAYAAGAVPEVVGDCGLLVAPDDVAGLASALERVLADAPLRERLTACGRSRAREVFSLERMVAAMRERYAAAAR